MRTPTREEVIAAVQTIIAAGASAYIEPSKVSDAKKFGMGISKVNSDSKFMLDATAEHLEDWNHHAEAQAVRDMIG